MAQSLSALYVQIVFSTKERRRYLAEKDLREETHRYLGGISAGLHCPPVLVGGAEDHVHVLASLGRTVSVADYVKALKTSSNGWLKSKGFASFGWQAGYGVFRFRGRTWSLSGRTSRIRRCTI